MYDAVIWRAGASPALAENGDFLRGESEPFGMPNVCFANIAYSRVCFPLAALIAT